MIRQADPGDLEQVAVLFDAYRQFYQQAPDLALARAFIGERLQARQSVILLAQTEAGESLGFCQLYPSFCSVAAAPIYVLYDLYVAPAARRFGAAKSLLLAAEQQALADGMVRMDLSTARDNLAAQALYESLGWERDEIFLVYSRQLACPTVSGDITAPSGR